jgi:hypothetical protein
MAYSVIALLSAAAGSGVAVILVQIRKFYREQTIRRVVEALVAAGKEDPQWTDRTLSRLLGAPPYSDPPIEPKKAELTDPPKYPPLADPPDPTADESTDSG